MAQKRPLILTITCVIGFIGAGVGLLALPMILSNPQSGDLPGWYAPYALISTLISLSSFIGIWQMKKWGPLTYTALLVVNQMVTIASGSWQLATLLIPVVVVIVSMIYLPVME